MISSRNTLVIIKKMGPELTSLFLLLSPGLRDQIGQTTRRGTSQTCYSQTLSCLAVDDPADLDVSVIEQSCRGKV